MTDSGTGWIDRRGQGRVRVDGSDAVTFLHALVSNNVAALEAETGCYATLLTPQGRMLADMRVYRRRDSLLLCVASGVAAALVSRLDSLIFAEQVQVADVSATLGQISVIGPGAADVIAETFDLDAAAIRVLDVHAQHTVGDAFVARTDDALVPSYDVCIPGPARDGVITRIESAGAVPLTTDDVESLRIAAGHPLYGHDMTDETIPLEAGLLDRAISTTKGCYVGQEVIIRVLHRGAGRVAKRLVRLVFDGDVPAVPAIGARIDADGRETGRITSAAISPDGGRVIALGYVHRNDAEVGRRVTTRDGAAEIVGLAG